MLLWLSGALDATIAPGMGTPVAGLEDEHEQRLSVGTSTVRTSHLAVDHSRADRLPRFSLGRFDRWIELEREAVSTWL